MKKFKARKKPVIVDAYQTSKKIEIKTIEGILTAQPGDYIVTGIDGEQWPVKKSIFEKTYERI
ncbi:hypothetical protein [Enterococcus hirae]|uniref:hypothetical protein n=1 Tax=Enterococcus hirae TaxID=1354 RepID=UPI002DBB26C3|nr:hypothetical protein [Enterococcus hirae]EMF0296977.1 hypothetical protein [Enterococcus hirae]MEB7516177.1 PGDYG domain-containing protein [Enterococcus hirae]MEB8420481.1 PGDYG domain-containing protein [Enterococcus hirae]